MYLQRLAGGTAMDNQAVCKAFGRAVVRFSAVLAIGCVATTAAQAAETVTYTYDALGRLITTQRSGGPANGVNAQTQYDPSGNRTNVTVSGAASNSPPVRVIVLPLNGYTVIPLGN